MEPEFLTPETRKSTVQTGILRMEAWHSHTGDSKVGNLRSKLESSQIETWKSNLQSWCVALFSFQTWNFRLDARISTIEISDSKLESSKVKLEVRTRINQSSSSKLATQIAVLHVEIRIFYFDFPNSKTVLANDILEVSLLRTGIWRIPTWDWTHNTQTIKNDVGTLKLETGNRFLRT